MTASVLIVDDHRLFREGLRGLLSNLPNVEVIAEAPDGASALRLAANTQPGLVILDVGMPEMNGVETARRLLQAVPETRILALSMHSDLRFVRSMQAAGASGYVLKDCAFEELGEAIDRILGGGTYLSPDLRTATLARPQAESDPKSSAPGADRLAPRERQVLRLIADGHGTRQIAERLGVSIKTIESHRKNIMDKLEIRTVAALTKFAIREGLTDLES